MDSIRRLGLMAIGLLLIGCPINDPSKNVEIKAVYDQQKCPDGHPLSVRISNSSEKTIRRATFSVIAGVRGYSEVIGLQEYSTNKIIPPGTYYQSCYEDPRKGAWARLSKIARRDGGEQPRQYRQSDIYYSVVGPGFEKTPRISFE